MKLLVITIAELVAFCGVINAQGEDLLPTARTTTCSEPEVRRNLNDTTGFLQDHDLEDNTEISGFISSSKSSAFDGYVCSYETPVNAGDSVGRAEVMAVVGLCTANSTTNCVSVAIYNGTTCDTASVCSLNPLAFTADCSGVSNEFPSCQLTCDANNTGNVLGIESCIQPYAADIGDGSGIINPSSSAAKPFGSLVFGLALTLISYLVL